MQMFYLFKKYRKTVFVVVYRRKNDKVEYLLLKRKLHWKGWEFTKGGIEKFETKKRTVIREVLEETGIKPLRVKYQKLEGYYKYKKDLPERPYIGQSYVLYSAELPFDSEVKIDGREHSSFEWMDFRKAIRKLSWPNQKECLKKV